MFIANGYPNYFFDKILRRFFDSNLSTKNSDNNPNDGYKLYNHILRWKEITKVCTIHYKIDEIKFGRKITHIHKTFKINRDILLKLRTPLALYSSVVYSSTYSCYMKHTNAYICMSSRQLDTMVRKHLNFNSLQNSAVKDHIMTCNSCSKIGFELDNFTIIRKYERDYHTKIHEAL